MPYLKERGRLDVGLRLREERKRLKLTQDQMAGIGGVLKQAQLKYEKGDSSPSADYLAAVAAEKVDVFYVLTGIPSPALKPEEVELLRRYRTAPAAVRVAVMAGLGAVAVGVSGDGPAITGGEQGQVVMGDQSNHASQTFNVGGKKGTKK